MRPGDRPHVGLAALVAVLLLGGFTVGVPAEPVAAASFDGSAVYSNLTGTVVVDVDNEHRTADGLVYRHFEQHATFHMDLVEVADLGGPPYWLQSGAKVDQDYRFHEYFFAGWPPELICDVTDRAADTAFYPDASFVLHVDPEYFETVTQADLGVTDGWPHYEPDTVQGSCDWNVYELRHTGLLDSEQRCEVPSVPGSNIGVYTETATTVTFHLDCTYVHLRQAGEERRSIHIVADLHGTKRAGWMQPLSPARVMDTRPGGWTVDGQYAAIGARWAGSTTELVIGGRAGVPRDASAVVLNVAVTEPLADGFLTLYPCGGALPLAASINFAAGQTVSNAVTARLGLNAATCIYAYAETHVVVDVTAAYPADAGFEAVVPARVLETRPGERTVDGQQQGIGLLAAGSTTEVVVAGRAGVPVNATTVVLNVAVTEPQAGGFLTVFPCGWSRPLAASLNHRAGQTVSNAVTAKIGDGGAVCIYTLAATHVVVDVTGALAGGVGFSPLLPGRVLETRPGEVTVDGVSQGVGIRSAGSTTTVVIAGRANVPSIASAVVLNVAVTSPAATGYLTFFPCGEARPTAASLNYGAGETISNAVTAKLGTGGAVCVFTYARAHVVIDVTAAQA